MRGGQVGQGGSGVAGDLGAGNVGERGAQLGIASTGTSEGMHVLSLVSVSECEEERWCWKPTVEQSECTMLVYIMPVLPDDQHLGQALCCWAQCA